jgi:hypothetical protein
MKKCQGLCADSGTCVGEVQRVVITFEGFDGVTHEEGVFNYCERAIAEDEGDGFTVTPIESDDVKTGFPGSVVS